jgi:hypothetical protein
LLVVHGSAKEVDAARGFIEKTRYVSVNTHARELVAVGSK